MNYAILPVNETRVTVGYKAYEYEKAYGFPHYGCDHADDDRLDLDLYAPCPMRITHAGTDNVLGNTVIAVSEGPVSIHHGPHKGKSIRLVFRFAHLEKIYCKVGDVLRPESAAFGRMGKTGQYANGIHLHMEVDRDIDYPNYSPTVGRDSNIWKKGLDTTLNPMDVLKVDTKGKHGFPQTLAYTKAYKAWMNEDDFQTYDLEGNVVHGTPL